jgi:hypothetical protein
MSTSTVERGSPANELAIDPPVVCLIPSDSSQPGHDGGFLFGGVERVRLKADATYGRATYKRRAA